MNSDDISTLISAASKPNNDIGFHQGRVIAWDQATSKNMISMAGAVLTDVPVLNGTEPLLLKEGDIVGMLRFKTSYFVLGRIIVPGQSSLLGTLPGLQQGAGQTEKAFDLTTDPRNVAAKAIMVPEWANQALVMCTVNASVRNTSEGHRFVYLAATVSGGYGGEMYISLESGQFGHVSAATQYLMGAESYDVGRDGPVPLGRQITVAARMRASDVMEETTSNIASVHAIAIFRRV